MRGMRAVGDHDFGDVVLGAGRPVLVQFHAPGSGACRQVGEMLEELAEELPWMAFTRLDAEANPETVGAYDVTGLPTLLVFHQGAAVLSIVGARPKRVVHDLLLGVTGAQPA